MTDNTKNILRTYLRRLTNLTGNNRSLSLMRLHSEQLLDVHSFSFLNGERSFGIINALIAGNEKKVCQVLDSRAEANNEVSRKLKKLQRIDHFIFDERGSNDLHVGWPFVEGKFSDGTPVRCPLLFFPVSLLQESNHWVLHPREDAGITFNKSFLLAYSFYNKVKLEEDLLETNFEDFDSDSTVFRTEVYQMLRDKIEINFNPDNFRDELIPFNEFKKDDFEQHHRDGEIKLFPQAVLGIFPQAGSQLVPDYMTLLENDTIIDLEDFFTGKSFLPAGAANAPITPKDTPVKEEKMYTPFVLDAYQENAIKAVKNGHSIVVQGPPGTGKSQLISNLLADAIASGKRALLVCQKRAALDVVYSRIKNIGLGDFAGLVHDFRNDRKEIFSTIARQIDRIDDYKAKNRSVDAIQMERRFFQVSRTIDQISEELEGFKSALFDERECGLSAKELYLTSNPHAASVNIRQEYQYFLFPGVSDFLRKLKQYAGYAAVFEEESYPWRDRKSFSTFNIAALKEILNVLSDIVRFPADTRTRVQALLNSAVSFDQCESFHAREAEVLGMTTLLRDDLIYRYFLAMSDQPDEETSVLWFSNVERVTMNCFREEGPEVTLSSGELGEFQGALQQRMRAQSGLRRLQWELFSSHKLLIKRVLVANNLPYNKEGLHVMEKRLDNRLNLEHHLTALRGKPWLIDLPTTYQRKVFTAWFDKQKLAIRAKHIYNSLREIKESIVVTEYPKMELISLLENLLRVVSEIPKHRQLWLTWLSTFQMRHLIRKPSSAEEYIQTVKRDFDNLCAYDTLKENLAPYEKDIIGKLRDETETWNGELLESLFQNSLRLAWIDHLEAKYPVLRSVSSMKMGEMQQELQLSVAEKQKLSKEILLLRARERVYDSLEYNRLNNRVTYRDLQHQVTKKKKMWPLRKVISEFQNELFNLLPCWLASPESVSAIFPMQDLFDLVIFDEASQCFAERGIPAMYRGKQLIIAGDDMQLKPNELYHVRWEEETEDPDLEVDSLLDLAERHLGTVHLQGHYRSKSLELIDFSNRHFYEGRLQLLPDRNVINRHQPGIEYNKVSGVWDNQTNRVEADAVVERVLTLVRINPEKEIGVVTFNAPQQMLIMDLLEDALANAGLGFPETLFVKNIENVQGDEKDIIIFSVGYAPDKKGKMMMQFGSLNVVGGENRLNVAITRAREKIILICSISPEDLKVDDIRNEGPGLLRKYLEYAREVDQKRFKPAVQYPAQQAHSWYLNQRLKTWLQQKFPDVAIGTDELPFSDLCFSCEGEYSGVMLTDDARYLSSLNIKDPHAYTPALLAHKHWDYHMIFSRNFWQNREKVENDLTLFVGTRIKK